MSDKPFTKENLDQYLQEYSREYLEQVIADADYEHLYKQIREDEKANKDILLDFQEEYPGITNKDNVDDIISTIRKKQGR